MAMRTDIVLLLLMTIFVKSWGLKVCSEPKDPGTCDKYVAKYFYDKDSGRCRPFWYGGCGGNGNQFDSSELCEKKCANAGLHQDDADNTDQNEIPESEILFEITNNGHSSVSDLCELPSDTGPCLNHSVKWFFDSKKQACGRFWYGGCQGNENRFDDSEACKKRCSKESNTQKLQVDTQEHTRHHEKFPAECQHPKHAGNCNNYTLHWYFEPSSATCRRFWYGSCGGNSNRFTSIDECEAKCLKGERDAPAVIPVNSANAGCANSVYGCCPDQQTAAQGPNYKGCKDSCVDSSYGCCPDGITPAEGQNQEGCEISSGNVPCEQTEYGCCSDGINTASGPSFKGCPDTPDSETRRVDANNVITQVATEKKCTAQESRDLCKEYTLKWRFDSQKQECVRHWWGGCADNGNVFESKEDCDNECKKTVIITQPVSPKQKVQKGTCTAPESRDLCTKFEVKWRFDDKKQECVRHWWGGCEDNGNVFESQADCEAVCVKTVVITNTDTVDPDFVNICDMEVVTGPCEGNIRRYYYNPRDRRCKLFYYGGCQGNENNFIGIEDCQRQCMGGVDISHSATTTKPETSTFITAAARTTVEPAENVHSSINMSGQSTAEKGSTVHIRCSAVGPRQPTEIEWFFNRQLISAEDTKLSVSTVVNPQLKQALVSELVIKNVDQENEGSYYCRSKPYGDLDKMQITVLEEERVTPATTDQRDPTAVCLMKAEPGPCYANKQRWHYDHLSGTCLQFVYGGCAGNNNNFATMEDCSSFCNEEEVCLQTKKVGPCRAAIPRFYFDSSTRSCQNFVYGGCGGNLNNFGTKEACDKKCHYYKDPGSNVDVIITDEDQESDVCQLKAEKGNCRGYNIKWYYSTDRKQCARFIYTGCGGNGNQFDSEQECSDTCLKDENTEDRYSVTDTFPTTQSTNFYPKSFSTVSVSQETRGDPRSVLVKLGDTIVLTCSLRNYGVHWYHDRFGLSSNSKFQVYNNGTLFLLTVTEDMAGSYTCTISNGYNVPQMETFKVHVYAPPRVLPGPTLISAKPGNTAVVHCQTVGSPKPVISWSRGGRVLQTSSHYTVFANGTLVIHNVLIHDAGEYECSADNGIAATTKRISLSIKETIGADIQSHQGIFTEGETIRLHCKGTGYPTPKLEWVKEGNVLKSDGKIQVVNGDLTVTTATIEDAGMYKCIAFNEKDKAEDVTTVQIKFHDPLAKCEDNMGRTRCHLIVTGRLCGFRIFTSKCCHSCRKAGFL